MNCSYEAGDLIPAGNSSLADWVLQGLDMSRLDQPGGYPFMVREHEGFGRHWLHSRHDVEISKGTRLRFLLTLRPIALPALRLRVDLAGKQVVNGAVAFSDCNTQVEEAVESLKVVKTEFGLVQIELVCRSDFEGGYVRFGLVFDTGSQCYDYEGQGWGLIVESANVQLLEQRSESETHVHSRYSTFGRMAYRLCRGAGLEIGVSGQRRFDLDANVLYLDCRNHRSSDEVARDRQLAQLVWSGGNYSFLNDDAFDFVIGSHVLERANDPRALLKEWLRVIRPGGILYMVAAEGEEDAHRRIGQSKPEETPARIGARESHFQAAISSTWPDSFCSCGEIVASLPVFRGDELRALLDDLRGAFAFNLEFFQPQDGHLHVALRKGGR